MHDFNSTVVGILFKTTSAFPSNYLDILPTHQQNLVIYRFKCQCDVDSVGKTIRQLEMRIAQHILFAGMHQLHHLGIHGHDSSLESTYWI